MRNDKEHIKILSTLSLAASDTRKDTLTSILCSSLFQNPVERGKLHEQIVRQFDFEPYESELSGILSELIDDGKIEDKSGILSLTEEQKLTLLKLETELQDKEKQRFQNFKNFIFDELEENLETNQIKLLWATFVEYLYNNFYEFGEEAVYKFHPHLENKEFQNKDEDLFSTAAKKLKDDNLFKLFKIIVEKFPEFASSDDLDFLFDLAQKTICFSSLGIDPDKASNEVNKSILDWVLYLDTNVLYSLLNLHSHPENEACIALVELINNNKDKLNIKLRYSELSKKELLAKKDDFKFIDENLTDNSIKGILKSEHLDDFTRQYYQNLLNDRESTLHPSKVIEFSSTTLLKKYKIDIGRNKLRLEQIGEKYLGIKIQDYRRYIDEKNLLKEEFYKSKGLNFKSIYKSDKQITHDISLRELLIHYRGSKLDKTNEITFNSITYFGLTIDSLLLEFDAKMLKEKDDENSFPVFFRPSYLLSKLVRTLPIKTNNYKKAFVKAVTTKGFNKDPQKSNDILKIVSYLRKQGIDDETVIFNLISKEIFLETYHKNSKSKDFDEAQFIESELNREIKSKTEAIEKTKEELELKNKKLEEKEFENSKLRENENVLLTKKKVLEDDLEIFKKSVKKLQGDMKRLEENFDKPKKQGEINFESGNEKEKNTKLKKRLKEEIQSKIKSYKRTEYIKWRNKIWLNLIWAIPLTLLAGYLVIFDDNILASNLDPSKVRFFIGALTLILDGILVKLYFYRYDEGTAQKKMENIEVPLELKKEVDEFDAD